MLFDLKPLLLVGISCVVLSCTNAPKPEPVHAIPPFTVSTGTAVRIDSFPSKHVTPRTIDIWLPDGYSVNKKYAVLYMHDGQMLFDTAKTWNKQEWHVDETAGRLQAEGKTRPFIVVGVWNNGEYRHSEYYPKATLSRMPDSLRAYISAAYHRNSSLADRYLKFLVTELKPYIDAKYSTEKGPESTFVAGSSMGGLISLYAVCEYPDVFGAAACISMHSPMLGVQGDGDSLDEKSPKYFRQYLREKLPPANSKRIYIDRGDQTLDQFYKPYQDKMDAVFVENGWKAPFFVSRVFPGTDHSEKSWSARLEIPLVFLAGK